MQLSGKRLVAKMGSLNCALNNKTTIVIIIPYSLKFSRLKFFAVFASYGWTTKLYPAKILCLHGDLWTWLFVC